MLSEFANVALRGVYPPVTADEVYSLIDHFEASFLLLPVTPSVVREAVRGVRDHRLSYFDAQIWASARLNQIPFILSEDFNSGGTLEGVTFIDPFSGDFEIEDL